MSVLVMAALLLAGTLAQPALAQVSFDLAYSNLSQHGSWVVSAQYGHVWQPWEYNRDWNPYYDGHWLYTDMGWTWVSDYEWGAIPYHYGTWVADPDHGWVWIPGNVWAPAWVVFRTGSDYIGWAPVPPGYSVGMSIDMGESSNFVFISSREFLAPRIRTLVIPASRSNVFINNTTVVNNIVIQNNIVVNRGPDVRIVEKATGRTIREERIESVARVAPFQHVSRAQLQVDPERVKHGLRVAEPVPATRPLPASVKRGNGGRKTPAADASKAVNKRPAARPNSQEAAIQPEAGSKANAGQNAKAPAKATVKATQTAKAPAKATVKKAAKARKPNPDKKEQNSDKGTTPAAKEGNKE